MKKIISLLAISSLILLTSCGEAEEVNTEVPVVDVVEEIIDEVIEEENVEGLLTDEEIDKELEEIFNID